MPRPVRYTFILGLVGLSTVMAAVGGWRYARASAPVRGPIILISVDGLRPDRLGAYGGVHPPTPAMDTLATDGVVFERAYSPSPQTLPAHAALLTGRLPVRTGVRDTVGFTLPAAEETVAEALRDRGYDTAAIVSSFALRRETGIDQGFAFFDDELTEDPFMAVGPVIRDGREAQQIAEHWLESAGTERAFLFLHLYGAGSFHRSPGPEPGYLERYDRAVSYADDAIGGLIQYLKSHQLYDRSTIILTSDHGEGLGDHGEQGHGLLLHDEAVRVPLVIKLAGDGGTGRRIRQPVLLVDIMPTIGDFARAPLPDDLDGESLAPLLEEDEERPEPRYLYAESLFGHYRFGWSPARSLSDGRYRFIRSEHEELYDLHADPREQTNVAADLPVETARLRARLDAIESATSRPRVPDARRDLPEDTIRRLEALGYVSSTWPATGPGGDLLRERERQVQVVESYRETVRLSASRRWFAAMDVLRELLENSPDHAGLWLRLAETAGLAGRHDWAADAYRRAAALRPDDLRAPLGAAQALLDAGRLTDAHAEAERVLSSEEPVGAAVKARAHELLARIALARRAAGAARIHAEAAVSFAPGAPLVDYVEGRLLHERGEFTEALAAFERAAAGAAARRSPPPIDLHLSTARTLLRLERHEDAEREFIQELVHFPGSLTARAELASLYHASGRAIDAANVIDELLLLHPTPEAYRTAARLWTAFGDPTRAAAVRAEGARAFPPAQASIPPPRR